MNMLTDRHTPIVLSVKELNLQAKQLLELNIGVIRVHGEISNLSKPKSGHIYFTLKDADSEIACAMFKRYVDQTQSIDLINNGVECCVEGLVSVYMQRGQYQLMAYRVSSYGEGLLKKQYLLLHAKLKAQGLFDTSKKRPLSPYPQTIAIISSPNAAGLQDFLVTLAQRYPPCSLVIYPAQVQGEQAAVEIIHAVKQADANNHDTIVLCRGGGSIEDLWCFNDENLALALSQCKTPTVSAIGHEIDWTITDEVADVRAATPTQAALLVATDSTQLKEKLNHYQHLLQQKITSYTVKARMQLQSLTQRLKHPLDRLRMNQLALHSLRTKLQHVIIRYLDQQQQRYDLASQKLDTKLLSNQIITYQRLVHVCKERLNKLLQSYLQAKKFVYLRLLDRITANDPKAMLKKGYAVITKKSHRLTSITEVNSGDKLRVQLHDGAFDSEVTK